MRRMSLTEIKKSPFKSLPYLKKRLRRITALGLRNLTVNELIFTVHFTLHRTEQTVAFYTSELLENQRSPEWSYLQFPTNVQFLQDFIMRVWITSSNYGRLFLEYDIHLDESLMPDEQKDDLLRTNNNTLWLEMFGYRFTDNDSRVNHPKPLPQIDSRTTISEKKSKQKHLVKSYDKSSLLRMKNVIEAIQTTNQSSRQCLECLQTLVDRNKDYFSNLRERESQRVRIANLKQQLFVQKLIYERRFDSNQHQQTKLNERKNHLEYNLLQLLTQQERLNSQITHLNQSKCLLHDFIQLTTFRQKEIIHEIYQHVYPIIRENGTEYSIKNIKLPPAQDKIYLTSLTREREYEIEAAVGYCAHLIVIISQVMQFPLRFPLEYYGALSIKIYDYTLQPPEFPLYLNADAHSFQYGLFLLNRNIGQIMHYCRVGSRHPDYRNTLENLKELLEQYFDNSNTKNQIQLYALNPQSLELPMLSNGNGSHNSSFNERPIMRNKRNSTANCLFSPSRSATSSLIEINHDKTNEDDTNDVDLFPTLNTISPRLTMQFFHQQ